jgi:hypothetical protein
LFLPDHIFGFSRWQDYGFGTQTWRVLIDEAGHPGEPLIRVPSIKPGVHALLHTFGKTCPRHALRAIDMLSGANVLSEIRTVYLCHVNAQISH